MDKYSPDLLPAVFGSEWLDLSSDQADAIRADFDNVVTSPRHFGYRALAYPRELAYDYRLRIGPGNLAGYATVLIVAKH